MCRNYNICIFFYDLATFQLSAMTYSTATNRSLVHSHFFLREYIHVHYRYYCSIDSSSILVRSIKRILLKFYYLNTLHYFLHLYSYYTNIRNSFDLINITITTATMRYTIITTTTIIYRYNFFR